MEYVGPAYEWDEEIVRGSFDDGKFTIWYLKDGRVRARAHGRPLRRPRPRARELIVERRVLDEAGRSALASLDADLE